MKKFIFNAILILVFLVGLSLLLYPTVSDYINNLHQSKAIVNYNNEISEMTKEEYDRVIESAHEYNKRLSDKTDQYKMSDEDIADYNSQLSVTSDNIMGYIDIPKIGCSLPIYHTTDDGILQTAVGHLEWTSLPVGGVNTHSVLSGHRGLPSAKLFTDIDKLKEGDSFVIRILDEELTYEVDQIRIVEPRQVDNLRIEEGQDLCTLVTCTPYGVNSHRLLVRGKRVSNLDSGEYISVTADAMKIDTMIMASVIGVPTFLIVFILILIVTGKKKRRKR